MDSEEALLSEAGEKAEKYLVFTIRGRHYALPSRLIGEAAAVEKIFPLPLVDAHVRGIINRYSVPYALIDIGMFLTGAATDPSRVIVLKEETDRLAFLIDDVADIVDVFPEGLLTVESDGGSPVHASFEWKGGQALCLDLGALLEAVRKSEAEA